MEIIVPSELNNKEKFLDCAAHLNYDKFYAKKFIHYHSCSDVDVYELMGDYRLQTLLYGWETLTVNCGGIITHETRHIVKVLAHHSLQLWFSQEWIRCNETLKRMLLHFLHRTAPLFGQIDVLNEIEWPYLLNFRGNPWRVPYLQRILKNLKHNKQNAIEHHIPPADVHDISFLQQEQLYIILLRLIKLFDAGSWQAVKQVALRVMVAWMECNESVSYEILLADKTSIALVAHLYLMTIFVTDDNRGYSIDNMMYNIRFYSQSMEEGESSEGFAYTPASLIARICVHLRFGKHGFFEHIVFKQFNLSPVTSFAVMLEAYTSYVLGNQLLELMAMNEKDFMTHLSQFKVLMHRYVEKRENSECFLRKEMTKLQAQANTNAPLHTAKLPFNYQQQICKGNRASNIGNYKNYDDHEHPLPNNDEQHDRQIDSVFQNVPNNDDVLDFVFKLLAQRTYSGWQFAKIVLLLKIIGHRLNTIEIWRYHPGLTTQFMLNLEYKLSDYYADLAKVFSKYPFMEAEFWLTAFYLNPTRNNYCEVKRCARLKRKRVAKDDEEHAPARPHNRNDKSDNIKYELLSSTIDVDEIVTLTNHDCPNADYDPIYKALQGLRLPRSVVKDLLTVAFQPRNKRYSWVLKTRELLERCSALLNSSDLKRKFVALNMAEANDHLKYLKIDYAKYKNRPQLDYGSIEEGYENAAIPTEVEMNYLSEEEEEVKKEDRPKPKRSTRKYWDEVITEDEDDDQDEQVSEDSETYNTTTGRRTRVRAAAVIANAMISDMDRIMRTGRRTPTALKTLSPMAQPVTEAKPEPSPENKIVEKRSLAELLRTSQKYTNVTRGFKDIPDIWSFDKNELVSGQHADNNILTESSSVLKKFMRLKELRRASLATKTAASAELQSPPLEPPRSCSSLSHNGDSQHSDELVIAISDGHDEDDLEESVESTPALPDLEESIVLSPALPDAMLSTEMKLEQPLEESEAVEMPEKTELESESSLTADETAEEASEQAIEKQMTIKIDDIEDCQDNKINCRSSIEKQLISNNINKNDMLEKENQSRVIIPSHAAQELENMPEKSAEHEEVKVEDEEMPMIRECAIKLDKISWEKQQNQRKEARSSPTDALVINEPEKDVNKEQNEDDEMRELQACVSEVKINISQYFISSASDNETDEDLNTSDASTENATARQIRECLTSKPFVCLKRLSLTDIVQLRGVRVRVRRTNFNNYYRGIEELSRLKLLAKNAQFQVGECYKAMSTVKPKQTARKRFRKFVHITSDSPKASSSVQRFKQFHHITSDSSTDPEDNVRPTQTTPVRRKPKTARSPGSRLRNVESLDIIELSSTSSVSSSSPVPSTVTSFSQVAMPLEMDPLYEEEIVPF